MISTTWKCPADAWKWLTSIINARGDVVRDENGKLCREVRDVGVTVLNPLRGWPIPGSGWNTPALEEYAKQLLKPEDSGFDYTYGRRLRQYPISWWKMDNGRYLSEHDIEQDQLAAVISRLLHSPSTRRAVAITWIPEQDNAGKNVPCLQVVDFLLRDGRLSLTAFFRSWDCGRAAPANMYGLGKLLSYVAGSIWVPAGSLTIMAASAHMYEE